MRAGSLWCPSRSAVPEALARDVLVRVNLDEAGLPSVLLRSTSGSAI